MILMKKYRFAAGTALHLPSILPVLATTESASFRHAVARRLRDDERSADAQGWPDRRPARVRGRRSPQMLSALANTTNPAPTSTSGCSVSA